MRAPAGSRTGPGSRGSCPRAIRRDRPGRFVLVLRDTARRDQLEGVARVARQAGAGPLRLRAQHVDRGGRLRTPVGPVVSPPPVGPFPRAQPEERRGRRRWPGSRSARRRRAMASIRRRRRLRWPGRRTVPPASVRRCRMLRRARFSVTSPQSWRRAARPPAWSAWSVTGGVVPGGDTVVGAPGAPRYGGLRRGAGDGGGRRAADIRRHHERRAAFALAAARRQAGRPGGSGLGPDDGAAAPTAGRRCRVCAWTRVVAAGVGTVARQVSGGVGFALAAVAVFARLDRSPRLQRSQPLQLAAGAGHRAVSGIGAHRTAARPRAQVQHGRDPFERAAAHARMPIRPLRTASSIPRPCAEAV
jgi:hypothetical protein